MPSKAALEAVYQDVGRRIEFLRADKRISQSELGRRLQHPLTRAAISNIEGGRQRVLVHVLLEIADVLDVDAREILPNRPSSAPPSLEAQLTAEGLAPRMAAQIAKVSATPEAP